MLGTDGAIDPLLRSLRPRSFASRPPACRRGHRRIRHAHHEQRFAAVPDLLNFLDDDALASDTRGWVYGALRLITGEPLANNPKLAAMVVPSRLHKNPAPPKASSSPNLGVRRSCRRFSSVTPPISRK